MKKILLLTTVITIVLSAMVFAQTSEAPDEGDGSINNPYQIEKWENLYWLSQKSDVWEGSHFIQTEDITFPEDITDWDNGAGWTPIGTENDPFTGTYDGGGKIIDNLYINRPTFGFQGFFGDVLGANTVISNLGIINANITGAHSTGTIAGTVRGASTVSSCYSSGTVKGNEILGGLIGIIVTGKVEYSYSTSNVEGSNRLGGLVGVLTANNGEISNSYSTGTIKGVSQIGGLLGRGNEAPDVNTKVTNSYSTGSVSGNNEVGGLIGRFIDSGPDITQSYWDTETSGTTSSAGGDGKTTAEMTNVDTFSDSDWDFTDNWEIIEGRTYPTLQWQGIADAINEEPPGAGTEGDPFKIATAENLYWITQDTGRLNLYYEQVADINLSNYNWEPIGQPSNYANPADNEMFRGVYDGQGYRITNLIANHTNEQFIGLFGGMVGNELEGDPPLARLENIILEDVFIQGSIRVGSLLGKINDNRYVTITRCSVVGREGRRRVAGTGTTGGLVGANNGFPTGNPANARSKMFECFANVDVYFIGTVVGEKIGGLVGCNQRGETYDSFALGNVYRENDGVYANRVGGFAGCVEQGLIQRSFSAGAVIPDQSDNNGDNIGGFVGNITGAGTGGIIDSYWDTGNSGWTDSAGGSVGKTEDEMKNPETFAGWDGVLWTIEQDSYPSLVWNPNFEAGMDDDLGDPGDIETFTGSLIFQAAGLYENEGIGFGDDQFYLGFQSADKEENEFYLIFAIYSIDPNNPAIVDFATPQNLGGYAKYSVYDQEQEAINISTAFNQDDYFLVQMPDQPNQLWYRYAGGSWKLVPGFDRDTVEGGKPDYTYKVMLSSLGILNTRSDTNEIEFAGDRGVAGQTLPVELSSFTAIITADVQVQLDWTAETETNMLGYNIYRSKTADLSDAEKANFIIIAAHNQSTARDYRFIDEDIEYGHNYYYWLQSNDFDLTHEFHGPVSVFVEDQGDGGTPIEFPIYTELKNVYPNPFNPGTNINFSLEEKSHVSITIYNTRGQKIRTLIDNEEYPKGRNHTIYWDGKDYRGNDLGSGIYLYIMEAGEDYREAKKIIMMK